jgi:hypothetical protein
MLFLCIIDVVALQNYCFRTAVLLLPHSCGLYYKTITIVIDAPSVVKSDATIWSVTFDDTRSVDYDRNMAKLASSITFMVLASFTSVTYDRQMTIVIVL